MHALAVRDVPHVPEDAETVDVRNPVELFLGQPLDLFERIGIPKASSVQEMRKSLPVRHDSLLFSSVASGESGPNRQPTHSVAGL